MEGETMRASDWIRVQSRLPERLGAVLAYDEAYGMVVADYSKREGWYSYEHGQLDYVTHWQPIELPQNAR